MEKIASVDQLKESIKTLELDQAYKLDLLKLQLNITIEKLKPVNLLKDTFNDVLSTPNLKSNLINGALGLVAGMLTKNLLVGAIASPVKRILGDVVQVGITSLVTKNANRIKTAGTNLFKKIFSKKSEL